MFSPIGVISSSDSTAAEPPSSAITTSSHYWTLENLAVDFADTGTNSGDTGSWYFNRFGYETSSNISLRDDGQGDASTLITFAQNYMTPEPEIAATGGDNSQTPKMPCDFSGDFTVEFAVRPTGYAGLWGPSVHMIGVFLVGFDAFGDGITMRPTFQLLSPVGSDTVFSTIPGSLQMQTDWIQSQTDYNNFVIKDARGTAAPTTDNTYHLLGTFEASTRTMSLYLDGSLQSSQTLTTQEYTDFLNGTDADAQKDLTKLDRYKRDRIYILADRVAASLPYGSRGYFQDLRIHQGVHMNASQAAEQATVYRLGSSLG